MVEHLYVKFGDTSCIGFSDIVLKNIQTDRQTDKRRWKPYPCDCSWRG